VEMNLCRFFNHLRIDRKTKTKVGIRCFSAKHVALRSKSKEWLAWNQNNVSEWSDIVYLRTVVSVSLHYKIQPIKLLVLYI
jgi:hypothetical protein